MYIYLYIYIYIALDSFLQLLIPRLEHSLNLKLRWIKFFRDDGIVIFTGDSQLVFNILDILNQEREELQFTTELCSCGNVLGCCQSCAKSIPYLDCLVSVYQELLEDGSSIPQIKTTTYSKPTDVHHYIHPSSCTPNLTKKSSAIIKGVAYRLRLTNMLDSDLLTSLNIFSGYLETSGYDKTTIITFFTNIMKVSNRSVAFKTKELDTSFTVPLVTKLHPALPNLSKIFDQFYPIIKDCPISSVIFPRESLLSAHRKLPSLSTILANNPFLAPNIPTSPKGFHQTPGCTCKLCKESTFATYISPSKNHIGRGFSIPEPINCLAVNLVYVVTCYCGLMYVGRTAEPKGRWSNHKSHIRNSVKTCNLASHCSTQHRSTMVGKNMISTTKDVRDHLTLTLLQSVGKDGSPDDLEQCEEQWRNRLQTWVPQGLNSREDGPALMRKKKLQLS